MMSAPREFILEWNSMHATPSPKSTSDAPEFFLTTPFDFFATSTDHTPAGTSTARQFSCSTSQYMRPDGVCGSSRYQLLRPQASNFSTFIATGRFSFFIRATDCSTPTASHNSNGPSSQLNPSRMARSISTTESAISGIRFAAYVHKSDSAAHKNWPTLSAFWDAPS